MSNALVMANIAKVKTLSRVMEPEGTAEEKTRLTCGQTFVLKSAHLAWLMCRSRYFDDLDGFYIKHQHYP